LLIVEDNPTNCEILCQQTQAAGMQVHAVPDGQRGLQAAIAASVAGRPYQVAILDMKMPQMDGLDLAAAIRREPGIAQLPLIMLTSLHSEGEGAAARGLGIRCYPGQAGAPPGAVPPHRPDAARRSHAGDGYRRDGAVVAWPGGTGFCWPRTTR